MANSIKDAFAEVGIDTGSPTNPDASDQAAAVAPTPGTAQPIGIGQITPGLVVLDLDPTALLEDKRVSYTGRPALRSGPFVCVWMDGELETIWTGLPRKHRI